MSAPAPPAGTRARTARARSQGAREEPGPARSSAHEDVAHVLDEYFRTRIDRAADHGEEYHRLWLGLRDAADGGKRFRPALVTGMYEVLGGSDARLAATVGAAVELLHTAFVIHDDVIDHDDVRRGRRNVSGTFYDHARLAGADDRRARSLGAAAGILAGDLALSGAGHMIAVSTAPPQVRAQLLDLFDHAIYVTAAGELSDVGFSVEPGAVGLSDILSMETHKTAAYSFQLPLQAGAVLAGADARTVEWLDGFGRLLGLAFQLYDDVQGVFGSAATTGKSVLTDVREGKMTPLIAHARTTDQWHRVERVLGDEQVTEAQVDAVRTVLEDAGSRRFIEDLAADCLSSAHARLPEVDLPDRFARWIETMTTALMVRPA